MQIIAKTALVPGDVVFGGTGQFEGVATVSATHSDQFPSVLGVADQVVAVDKRSTIVVAGVVAVNKYNSTPVTFGAIIATNATVKGMSLQLPVGTLIEDNVEGILQGDTYMPRMRVFLCPWMCAFTLPLVYQQTSSNPIETVVTTPETRIVQHVTSYKRTSIDQVDLSRLFGEKGYEIFLKQLGLNGVDDQSTIDQLQTAVFAARKSTEVPQWCGIQ
jgi:hypothetical protein